MIFSSDMSNMFVRLNYALQYGVCLKYIKFNIEPLNDDFFPHPRGTLISIFFFQMANQTNGRKILSKIYVD